MGESIICKKLFAKLGYLLLFAVKIPDNNGWKMLSSSSLYSSL